jgi:hypothetical protein
LIGLGRSVGRLVCDGLFVHFFGWSVGRPVGDLLGRSDGWMVSLSFIWSFSMSVSHSCGHVFHLVRRSLVWSVDWLVGGLAAGLVEGFQPRRDHEGTDLVHLALRRNPIIILQEAGWAPETVWTGLEVPLPTP